MRYPLDARSDRRRDGRLFRVAISEGVRGEAGESPALCRNGDGGFAS